MAERAVFLSRTSAYFALMRHARRVGVPDTIIARKGRTHAKYKRGQFIGWEAWYPAHADATYSVPVMEEAV